MLNHLPVLVIGIFNLLLFQFDQSIISNSEVPFDSSNPVLYDNDDHRDTYTDEYLFALASAGDIQLKGVVTSYSGDELEYDLFVKGRQQIIDKARISGYTHLPDGTIGPKTCLLRPESNRIEDTHALNSEGGKLIVQLAMDASPAKPLVIIAGGQLTAIADAYLINPAIADRIIVSGIFGVRDQTYNAGLDAWAWAIVVSNMRCFSISDSDTDMVYNRVFKTSCPDTPKSRFADEIQKGILNNNEINQWMHAKRHPKHPPSYMERDADGPAAIVLSKPDYVQNIERWTCTGLDANGVPQVIPDPAGSLYLVMEADRDIGTEEFWRAIRKPTR